MAEDGNDRKAWIKRIVDGPTLQSIARWRATRAIVGFVKAFFTLGSFP